MARELHRSTDSQAHEVIDSEEVGAIGRTVQAWASSYGMVDRADREHRHVILHASRLVTALDPPLDLRTREVLVKAVTWLVVSERADGSQPLRALLHDARGSGPIEKAAAALLQEMKELDLVLDDQAWELASRPKTDVSTVDRAAHWLDALLWATTHDQPVPALDIELLLPPAWIADVNPCAFDVEADVEAWLRAIGVIKSDETRRVFQELTVAEYVGWPCPQATYDQLWVVMGFLSLWIFHDDNLEGVGAESPELLAQAISGHLELDDPALSNRYLRGWAELGWRLARAMSPRWLERHHDSFLEWVDAVGQEAAALHAYRQEEHVPTVEQYFELRRKTIGTYPTSNFLEYFLGLELPEEVLQSPRFATILDTMTDIVSIHNDLFGFSTDTTRQMLNLVFSRVAEGASCHDAFCELADLHNEKIRSLAGDLAALEQESDEEIRDMMQQWTRGVQTIVSGFVQWHAMTPRYSDVHRLPDGKVVRVVLAPDPMLDD